MPALLVARGASAQADVLWNRHQLEQWILAQRPSTSALLAAELPGWPEWPGRCHGLDTYFANVGAEFRRRCGPVIENQVEETRKSCVEGAGDPISLLRNLPECAGEAATLPFWVKRLGTCALTSYVTAAEMSEQDREDWLRMIDGMTDLRSLLGLGEVLQGGRLAGLAELGEGERPGSLEDLGELYDEVRALGKEQVERHERLVQAVAELGGVGEALWTLPALRRSAIAGLGESAIEALAACRPERALDLVTTARMEMLRHVQHRRANLVIAEHAYHCQATRGGFDGWPIARQRQFLRAGPDTGIWDDDPRHMLHNRWREERRQLGAADQAFVRLAEDPRLAAASFEATESRRREHERRWSEAAAAARVCLATCGERRDGCSLPLETLEQHLRTLAGDVCAREETARRLDAPALLDTLARAPMALGRIGALLAAAEGRIDAALDRCALDEARGALETASRDLGAEIRSSGWGPVCGAQRLQGAAARIEGRGRAIADSVGGTRAAFGAARDALAACRDDEAEARMAAAWGTLVESGCPIDSSPLAAARGEADALQAEVEATRRVRAAARSAFDARAADLLARLRAETERGESSDPSRCAALGSARETATVLAALRSEERCVEATWDSEAEVERARIERAWERGRPGFELWLAQAEGARERCNAAAIAAAIEGIRSSEPVCGVDRQGALARLETLRDETARRTHPGGGCSESAEPPELAESAASGLATSDGGDGGWEVGERVEVVDPCSGARPVYQSALEAVIAAVVARDLEAVERRVGALRPECPGDAARLRALRDQAVELATLEAERNSVSMREAVGAVRERERARQAAWASAAGALQGLLAQIQRTQAGAGGVSVGAFGDESPPGGGPGGTGSRGGTSGSAGPHCLVEARVDTSAGNRVFFVLATSINACGRSYPSYGIRGSSGTAPLSGVGFSGPYPTLAAAQAEVDRRCPAAARATGGIRCQ